MSATELHIRKFFDAHIHFREDKMLLNVAPFTADYCSYAVVMPNLQKPVCNARDVDNYRNDIMRAVGANSGFNPLMTFKVYPDTSAQEVRELARVGTKAGKIYPRGLTTNAHDGIEDYFGLHHILATMEQEKMILCLHGEKPGKDIPGLKREHEFLRTLFYLARTYPNLKIVLEHITTAAAVDAVLKLDANVAATITAHHLYLTHDDVAGDKLHPHNFCKPIAKHAEDRAALIEAAISNCPKFFFGSDSAPHPRNSKECSDCCAGVFTAPIIGPLLAQIFDIQHALNRLEKFVYHHGAHFYEIPDDSKPVMGTLQKVPMCVPGEYAGGVVPFKANETLDWTLKF